MMKNCLYLGGGMPTDNARFAGATYTTTPSTTTSYSTYLFIVGDFMVIRPMELRFNEVMTLKEDYDYTVQHIKEYGGALRNRQVMMRF